MRHRFTLAAAALILGGGCTCGPRPATDAGQTGDTDSDLPGGDAQPATDAAPATDAGPGVCGTGSGTEAWAPLTATGAPGRRRFHSAVWTGTEMIVWGGADDTPITTALASGARYDPAADSWTPLPTAGAPLPRFFHSAVWTGSEMIVWGGFNEVAILADGARYDIAANTWTPMTSLAPPEPRWGHATAWSGTEMIVWGGEGGASASLSSGGRYDPLQDLWTETGGTPPLARSGVAAAWSGTELLVWGGSARTCSSCPVTPHGDGARYDPVADAWAPMSTIGAPAARIAQQGAWTGTELFVWGGYEYPTGTYFVEGGRYAPATDAWASLPTACAPSGRESFVMVSTGSEILVWGGYDPFTVSLDDGARFDLAADTWSAMTPAGAPGRRYNHAAVWTGAELIFWGGDAPVVSGNHFILEDGARYTP